MAVTITGDGVVTGLAVGGLPDGVIDNGCMADDAIDSAELADGAFPLSFRNLIANGACNVAQRATSYTGDVQGYQSVDRYSIFWAGADAIIERHQETLTSSDTGPWEKGFKHAYKLVNGNQSGGAGAADYVEFQTALEGKDVCNSGWVPTDTNSKLTISYWAKSSVAQTFYMRFRVFLASTQYEYTYSVALSANTWTKVTKTIPGNSNFSTIISTNEKGFFHSWSLFHGTDKTNNKTLDEWAVKDNANKSPDCTSTWWTTDDATFHVTGVQLEVGDTATPFEHRTYADELARCQRYCQRVFLRAYSATAQAFSDSTCAAPVWLRTEMRAAPTVTLPNTTSANSAGQIAFTNHTGSWPATHGTMSADYITKSKFTVSGTGFTSASFGAAGNAVQLYATAHADGTNASILCSADI